MSQFGTRQCWELDALAPDVIVDLIRGQIEPMIDAKAWAAAAQEEERNREALSKLTEELT